MLPVNAVVSLLTQDGGADEEAEGDGEEGGEPLLPDAGEDDEEGEVERAEDDAERDGGGVARHRRPVRRRVQRRAAVLPEQVEPAAHLGLLG